MKPLLFGAVLALLWLLLGLPLTALGSVLQPVTVASAAGVFARPHLAGRRWSR
ncbi:hypothetical protein ACWD4O_10280 [Streptomyces sp. NPDC002623]